MVMASKRVCSPNQRSVQPQGVNLEELESRLLLSATGLTAAALTDASLMTPTLQAPAAGPFDTITAQPYYTPSQIRAAYGFGSIVFTNSKGQKVAGDGTGETIAIVDAYEDPHITADLQAFDAAFGISDNDGKGNFALTTVMMAPASQMTTDDGWAMETALDVEWAHAVAPGAHILLVEAVSAGIGDLLGAVDYARNQTGVVAVSMSWGGGEMHSEKYFDTYFTTPAGHRGGYGLLGGVTFVAAAGDDGAGAEWPSVSPNVVAVGGTTLSTTSSGAWGAETAWSGSGGGVSMYEPKPTYQDLNVIGGSYRTNPDVSIDADPNTGYPIYDNGWLTIGGTSAGAPQWSALIAIADQGRALKGKGSLNGATQALPDLYSLPANDFHDITSGSNGYSATAGYDLATGRGSPKANLIAMDLLTINAIAFPKTPAVKLSALGAKLGYNLAGSGDSQTTTPATSAETRAWGVSDLIAATVTSNQRPSDWAGESADTVKLSPWIAAAPQLQFLAPRDGGESSTVGTTSGQDQNAPETDSALSIAGSVIGPLDTESQLITV
jgi:subtilase family serine protease